MKKLFILIYLLLIFPKTYNAITSTSSSYNNDLKVYVFYDDNCKNCNKEKEWLDTIKNIDVSYLNIKDNNNLLKTIKKELNIKKDKYPLTIIGTTYFNKYNKKSIENAIASYKDKSYCDLIYKIENNDNIDNCKKINKDIYKEKNNILIIIILVVLLSILILFILLKKYKLKKIKI